MARIRSIKPDLWLSPQVMNLELGARLLFIGLITQADDQGRGVADPRRLKAAVLPGDQDVTAVQVDGWLSAIEAEGLAILYTAENHGRLYQLRTWHVHQSINKANPSNYPPPPELRTDGDGSSTGAIPYDSRGIGKEGKGREQFALARGVVGLNLEAWDRWLEYRTALRKPIKAASAMAAAKDMAAYGALQSAVVEQSIAAGWQGLFPLKPKKQGGVSDRGIHAGINMT